MVNDKAQEVKLTPTNDFIFKRIFGKEGNERITKKLLSSIIEDEIADLTLAKEQTTDVDVVDDKIGILDVEVKLSNGTKLDLEMQFTSQKDIEKRLMFYWSKLYSSNIKSGEEYYNLKRVVVIMFTTFNLEKLKEIQKCHTKWEIREREYGNIVLTRDFEIDIIEMKKLEESIKNKGKNSKINRELASWIQFLTNPDELEEDVMEDIEEIKLAKEELEKIRQDEHDRRVAELREKYIRDQKGIEAYGFDKGVEVRKRRRRKNWGSARTC